MMLEFKMSEKAISFENEEYVTRMKINGKGEGRDHGELRLRCAVSITLFVKETENILNLRGNIYWDAAYPKAHIFFTGGSLVDFIEEQGYEYNDFKEYWSRVKRLATNVFSDDEIKAYQKMLKNHQITV